MLPPHHIATVFAALLLSTPAWAVHKCKDQYGRTVYQESPCESTAKQLDFKLQPVPETTPYDSAINAAIAKGKVAIGMTSEQVIRSWGRPTKVNKTITAQSDNEQWVYDRGRFRAQYVYLENGIVRSVQSPD